MPKAGGFVADPAERAEQQGKAWAAVLGLRAESVAAVRAALDDDQKKVFDKGLGKPLDLTKLGAKVTGDFTPFIATGYPWSPAAGWQTRAAAFETAGRYADAKAAYQESLRLKPGVVAIQADLAWLLATCPDAAVRDGKAAVELMTELKGNTPLDVLAAAYAEVGRFDDAVKTQEQAIERAKAGPAAKGFPLEFSARLAERLAEYEERLKLYKSKKPYRNPPAGKDPTAG
jgi:tetratricopeptide (TPR) repeat protein